MFIQAPPPDKKVRIELPGKDVKLEKDSVVPPSVKKEEVIVESGPVVYTPEGMCHSLYI